MKDYYQVLGIERNASDAEIKKAYRSLAMKYHPDRNQGEKESEEKFKEINEAYSCLSDPQKRAHFDRFGTADAGAGAGYGAGAAGFGDIFEDIFGDFFGGSGGRRAQRRMKGSDLRFDMDITLEESARGVEKIIDILKWENCSDCGGSGSKSGKRTICRDCGGHGQVRFQQGFFSIAKACSNCMGTGQVVSDPCEKCKGQGKMRIPKKVSLRIPPGVDTGSRLKLTGEGDPGINGGPSGDLYVIIEIEPHAFFRRDGNNLYCEIPISFAQAVIGTAIDVPTLGGTMLKLKVPAGTQPGTSFPMKGAGIQGISSRHKGDMIVTVDVTIPKKISQRQKELIEEFDKLTEDESSTSFKDRIKNMFAGSA